MTPTLRFACHLVAAIVLVAALGALTAVRANHYILCPEDDKCADTGWSLTGSLNSARQNHSATLMRDGKVMVAGGSDASGTVLATVELYDPATGTWVFAAPMINARAGHFAFLLPSGEVVVIGGDQPCCFSNVSAEIYNPESGVWTPAGSLESPLGLLSATMLPSGKIFLSGIADYYRATASWLYDAEQQVWTRAVGDPIYRQVPSLSVLRDGTVLVTGGSRDADEVVISPGAELFDPTIGWNATSSPDTPRLAGTATLLADGRLLLVGGYTPVRGRLGGEARVACSLLPTSEFYGADGTWHPAGSLNEARMLHTATLLPDGRVLVAGGVASQSDASGSSTWSSLATAELYDPVLMNWTNADSLAVARMSHTATLLKNGDVLVVGGVGGGSSTGATALRSAEIYHP